MPKIPPENDIDGYARKLQAIFQKLLKQNKDYKVSPDNTIDFLSISEGEVKKIIAFFNNLDDPIFIRKEIDKSKELFLYNLRFADLIYQINNWAGESLFRNRDILSITALDAAFVNSIYNNYYPAISDAADHSPLSPEEKKYATYYMRKFSQTLMVDNLFSGLDNEKSLIYFSHYHDPSMVEVVMYSDTTDEKGLVRLSSSKIPLSTFKDFAKNGYALYHQEKPSNILQLEQDARRYLLQNALQFKTDNKFNGLGSDHTELTLEHFEENNVVDVVIKIAKGNAEISRTRIKREELIALIGSDKNVPTYTHLLGLLAQPPADSPHPVIIEEDPDLQGFICIEKSASSNNSPLPENLQIDISASEATYITPRLSTCAI